MSLYKKILVAIDLTEESPMVLDKARNLAGESEAEIHIVHVIEPIAVGYAIEVSSVDIDGLHKEAARQARESLLETGGNLGLSESNLHSKLGSPAKEIRTLAKELGADLIIMGGHGKHGLDLFFGSTSSEVAHGVGCDLLIVRIPD